MRFFNYLFLMAPNFLTLVTTLENLGARRLLTKKVNFVPCMYVTLGGRPQYLLRGNWPHKCDIILCNITIIQDHGGNFTKSSGTKYMGNY